MVGREKILVDIPQTDMIFFKLFADKLGWQFNSRQSLWDEYIKNSPENADLSEEEIMEEVRAARYVSAGVFQIDEEQSPYNKDFVEEILESRKSKGVVIKTEDLWK